MSIESFEQAGFADPADATELQEYFTVETLEFGEEECETEAEARTLAAFNLGMFCAKGNTTATCEVYRKFRSEGLDSEIEDLTAAVAELYYNEDEQKVMED